MVPSVRRPGLTHHGPAFTLVELLVTLAVIGVLAALLLPALAKAKRLAVRTSCASQLRQQGLAWQMYLDDQGGRFPDRRDLKESLPGGYRPWTDWPPSDPRAGWAALVLAQEVSSTEVWSCPGLKGPLARAIQTRQRSGRESPAATVSYWMWRFDRMDEPITPDNFWGRTPNECVAALQQADNPRLGRPNSPLEVELTVDVYFPSPTPGVPEELRGVTPHAGGRNRLLLDGHTDFLKDTRTPR